MFGMLFVTFAVIFYFVLYLLTHRRQAVGRRLDMAKRPKDPKLAFRPHKGGEWLRAVLARVVSSWVKSRSTKVLEQVHGRLAQAGFPGGMNVSEWLGVRFVCLLGCIGIGVFVLSLLGGSVHGLFILVACILLGWMGPDFWLSRQITFRQKVLLRQLPSALDLLSVSVEAGLGFDQALSRVAHKIRSPLADEFDRGIREIQLGSPRAQALQRMAERTGLDEVKTFVSAIVQADKLGIGMTQVLRVQSAEMRRKRKMDAQERAMKAPVKMLFPLVIFVFPALFLIILGPALLHIIHMFGQGGLAG